jgi:hypothetical protein
MEDWTGLEVFAQPMIDRDAIFFPMQRRSGRTSIAFAQLMFAHSEFEREVRSLQAAITNDANFGEQRNNQWKARKRPELMARLIKRHLGDDLQEAEPIVKILHDAIGPCDRRNFLAHGDWWCFNTRTLTITVRSGTRWSEGQPDHVEYTAQDIKALAGEFERLQIELFKLRRRINARR